MTRQWEIASPWMGRMELARRLKVPDLVAQLLYNREIDSPEDASVFLDPQLSRLAVPQIIPNINRAAERIVQAVRDGQKIVLYGDYDVDGITAIAILWHCLRLMGAKAQYYVPNRLEEGYGVNAAAVRQLAADGAKLIVTVDCGIKACQEARLARELGIDLIVTDHHQIEQDRPDAFCIVHPCLEGDGGPCAELSGAGVALKLAWAMAQQFVRADKVSPEFREFLVDATGLAALGTIADVVPLTGENRILAHYGLRGLAASKLAGIKALIASAGLRNEKLDTYSVGFKLAPRLNAAGRMGHAPLAADMLTGCDEPRAIQIAQHLEQSNRQRQSIEKQIVEQARQMVIDAGMDRPDRRAIVLASAGWHVGVIGIVASRMVEMFHRPTILISLDGEIGQGSGRSIHGFSLVEALHRCRCHLATFGGHKMAAGLKILPEKVRPFADAFIEYANTRIKNSQLVPKLRIDAAIRLEEMTEPLVRQIRAMAPFGTGNPRPMLCTEWCDLAGEPRRVGGNGQHLQFALRNGAQVIKGIAFSQGNMAEALAAQRKCKVAFEPIINEYMGRRSVEMQVEDMVLPDGKGKGQDGGQAMTAG